MEIEKTDEPGRSWQNSRWLILVEFALVAAIYVGRQHHILKVSVVPYLFLLGWISLRIRKLQWRQIGFAPYRTWTRSLVLGIGCGVGLELFDLFGKQRLLTRLLGKSPDLSGFADVRENLKFALLMIVLIWILAAFGEELVYRGYLMNRIADLGRGTRTAWVLSLVLTSCVFGLTHYQQGLTGIIEEGSDGVILGLIYLACRRNLAVPIIAHGVCDTIDIVLLFLGKYPGLWGLSPCFHTNRRRSARVAGSGNSRWHGKTAQARRPVLLGGKSGVSGFAGVYREDRERRRAEARACGSGSGAGDYGSGAESWTRINSSGAKAAE